MVRRLATFGQLIGNTDMHFGNLSFFFSHGEPLSLAPVYDMLPMLYAPVAGDQLPQRTFEPPFPTADTLHLFGDMVELARTFWEEVGAHASVSKEFSEQAQRNAARISEVRSLAGVVTGSANPPV